jgi:hypothetical protein
MTGLELGHMLSLVEDAMTTNRQLVDKSIIDMLRAFVNDLQIHPAAQEIAQRVTPPGIYGDFSVDKFIKGLNNAINVEEKLIGEEGNTIINVCSNLRRHTFILNLLARFMS